MHLLGYIKHNLIEDLNIHSFGMRYGLGGKEKVENSRLCSNTAYLGQQEKKVLTLEEAQD